MEHRPQRSRRSSTAPSPERKNAGGAAAPPALNRRPSRLRARLAFLTHGRLFALHQVGLLELVVALVEWMLTFHVGLQLFGVGDFRVAHFAFHGTSLPMRSEAPEPCGSSASSRKRAYSRRYRAQIRSQFGGRRVPYARGGRYEHDWRGDQQPGRGGEEDDRAVAGRPERDRR